jgi:hypothetical protein
MNSKTLQYGLMMGAIQIVIALGFYAAGPEMMAGFLATSVSLLVTIGGIVFFAIKARTDNGGYFTFKEAFVATFVIGFTAAVVNSIFNYVLYNFIDPSLAAQIQEIALKTVESTMRSMGADEAAIAEGIAQAAKEDPSITIGKTLMGLGMGAGFGAVMSAIIAAIIKKENPDEEI